MKRFIIEEDFWSLFPDAHIGVVVCRGIDNSVKDAKKYEELLLQAEKEALKYLNDSEFSKNEVIKVWREAFRKFKTKKGARSSVEALMKRVHNGKHIGSINPLVDIYNSISLKYALPCGGEDIDSFQGDIRLTKASGGEHFVPLGTEENSPPYEGEIIYKDDKGAICRCWNWRESSRTILKESTKKAFLCIETVDAKRLSELKKALENLAHLVLRNVGGTNEIHILNIDNKEIIID